MPGIAGLYDDLDMTKVMFGKDAARGYGCITFQPIWETNPQGRLLTAVVGPIAVDIDVLSEECKTNRYPHEVIECEVIFRPVRRATGKGLAGYGLAGIAMTHPLDLFELVTKEMHCKG